VAAFQDLFSRDSRSYAEFRPRYPAGLFAALAGLVARHDDAWDVGTGNGQAAVALAEHFARVIATDASAAQIAAAEQHARVEYRVARAESSGLDDASVDLVTVAQALHWFDIPAFFAEAKRVVRPDGVVAVWTYGLLTIDPAIDGKIETFEMQTVGPYWPAERRLVDSGYRTIDFPFEEIEMPSFVIEQAMTLDALTGYMGTWSSVAGYIKARGADPVAPFIADIAAWWGDRARARVVRWPITVRAGRRD
jgi:SAM-dependent methyltransferase